jgi:heme exporter protein A
MKLVGEQLTCIRGERTVFSNVGFSLTAGEMLVLKGANGAGKTSLLRLIAGLGEPAGGRLHLEGGHAELSIAQQCHFVAHQNAIKPSLTVRENLEFWAGFLAGAHVDDALEAFNLTPLSSYAAALLSAGQSRRLNLARLIVAPRVLWLLDEPTVGLDAASTEALRNRMHTHLERGGMIIATTHVDLGMPQASTFDFANQEAAA